MLLQAMPDAASPALHTTTQRRYVAAARGMSVGQLRHARGEFVPARG